MRFLRDFLLENWGLKLTSIFLAFFLWLAVRGEPPAERLVTIPLEIVLPADMEITGERPSTVDVTLRGAAGNMWLGQPIPSCRIDLENAVEGEHVVTLTPANVRVPRTAGLEVLSIRPARIKLALERTISRVVPIRVTRGDPPLEFEVYGVSVTPPTATVTGPRSHVDRIREVRTESVSLAAQRESFRAPARLSVEDSAIHVEPPGPVEVNIQLGERRQLQTILRVPVVADDSTVTVIPPRLSLRVLVPISLQRNLTAADFVVTVTTLELDPAQKVLQVKPQVKHKIQPDPGVAVIEVKPDEVTVRRAGNS